MNRKIIITKANLFLFLESCLRWSLDYFVLSTTLYTLYAEISYSIILAKAHRY